MPATRDNHIPDQPSVLLTVQTLCIWSSDTLKVRDVLEEKGGGGLEPKDVCTKSGPNRYFLLQISLFPTTKSGEVGLAQGLGGWWLALPNLGGGGGLGGGTPPPAVVVSISNTPLLTYIGVSCRTEKGSLVFVCTVFILSCVMGTFRDGWR